jgi:hypothetical protein
METFTTTVEYVRSVGYNWSFYPGVDPMLFREPANISGREKLRRFDKDPEVSIS